MLIKEYRIPLPLSVEEYKIAQLYMIAKISRDETKDAGSGIQILINEPYKNGPEGTNGQYTKKIYYVREYLPGWIKSLLPKSSLNVEEEAWNAYPYTKTRYTSPFIEKFFIEIDTVYCGDCGNQQNVFNLTGNDLRNRIIDVIDVVKDYVDAGNEEDPTLYISEKTKRGPLTVNWLEEYSRNLTDSKKKTEIMCAYKLCKVDFRYWGMQAKLEKFIHDFALRKTMLKAHRRAWLWQDEWYGLTMDDIREIEKQTQEILRNKMAAAMGTLSVETCNDKLDYQQQQKQEQQQRTNDSLSSTNIATTLGSIEKLDYELGAAFAQKSITSGFTKSGASTLTSNNRIPTSTASEWKIGSLARDSDSEHSNEDDEFFDCQEDISSEANASRLLVKWSSLDLLAEEDVESGPNFSDKGEGSVFSGIDPLKRTSSERVRVGGISHISCPGSPTLSVISMAEGENQPLVCRSFCKINCLLLVVHAGSILEASADVTAKKSDITTLRGSFEHVMRQHYPTMIGRIAVKLVPCPAVTTSSLSILSSLSPYSFDVSPSSTDAPHFTHDSIPMGVIPVLSVISSHYREILRKMISTANTVYKDFLKSEEGLGFCGTVSIIGDSMGAILAHDALCYSRLDFEDLSPKEIGNIKNISDLSASVIDFSENRRLSSTGEEADKHSSYKMDFEVRNLFMFGSPVSLILAFRKLNGEPFKCKLESDASDFLKPSVHQVYNLFHPSDPVASRLEPLICNRFSMLPPVNIPRYQKYPLGNGLPYHLLEVIQTNVQLFTEMNSSTVTSVCNTVNNSMQMRRMSEASLFSNSSGLLQEPLPIQIISDISQKWWGNKRLDYALYCPDGLSNFPINALPHLFHASYWESYDVVAFILRQISGFDLLPSGDNNNEDQDLSGFIPGQPREKWIRKRTSVKLNKLKNIGANHRANDVIVKEGAPQILSARFMYGSYDVITLTGEKVDIHVMNDGGGVGDWIYLSTQVTDKTGRIIYTIPQDKSFSYGIHHVKMVVRGDHTSVDFRLAVVPPKTESVVFSIDGSFTASVSVTGRDPKVRAGAVDVVRQWQELGYLILYISARPDMQQQMVLSWLAQHNFPYGLVAFADRFSTDPLGYKTSYLKNLTQEHGLIICSAYGSSKDIAVYSTVGLKPSQIFIVGRVNKKYQNMATVLSEGYATHLSNLLSHGGPRPAQGNARMVLFPRGCFGHNSSIRRRRSAKRTTSFPLSNVSSSSSSIVSGPGLSSTSHQKF
ncbi:hypothetical protein PGB90_004033 [Kerria lacca]